MPPVKENKPWKNPHSDNKNKSWRELNAERKNKRRKLKEDLLKKELLKDITKQPLTTQPKEEVIKHRSISTISVAIPGSILENAQSDELRSYLAGQIARALCIFQVDEIIIFDDMIKQINPQEITVEEIDSQRVLRRSCVQLGRILQYLECPQYLRKQLFPVHKDLQYAGLLNPLDAPHHLRRTDNFGYREGIVTTKPVPDGKGSLVNVGLFHEIIVDKVLVAGTRCTVKLITSGKRVSGTVVSPKTPREDTGVYWGYNVRLANCLSQVMSQCPYNKGYDVTIGTSDKGTSIDEFDGVKYKHLLIVFGGLQGLEAALENDNSLDVDEPKLLFDHYLNTLPQQGSRTIRTEEAILVSLAALRPKIHPKRQPLSATSLI